MWSIIAGDDHGPGADVACYNKLQDMHPTSNLTLLCLKIGDLSTLRPIHKVRGWCTFIQLHGLIAIDPTPVNRQKRHWQDTFAVGLSTVGPEGAFIERIDREKKRGPSQVLVLQCLVDAARVSGEDMLKYEEYKRCCRYCFSLRRPGPCIWCKRGNVNTSTRTTPSELTPAGEREMSQKAQKTM